MITILEFVKLSKHVYRPSTPLIGQAEENILLTENNISSFKARKFDSLAIVSDLDGQPAPDKNFYAQLYIKFDHGEATDAIVAFRGTVMSNKNNDIVDITSWFSDALGDGASDDIPVYASLANLFYCDACNYIEENFSHYIPIHVTGHSLGGALAQLIPARFKHHALAVTFNSPGIGNMSRVNWAQAKFVHGINSRYGFINKVGKTFGSVNWIDVPNDEHQAKIIIDHFNQLDYQHSMDHYKTADMLKKKADFPALVNIEDMIGFVERIKAYTSTTDGVSSLPSVKAKVKAAEHKHLSFDETEKMKLNAFLTEYENVIIAQHSIDHVINALEEARYQSLAHKVFTGAREHTNIAMAF